MMASAAATSRPLAITRPPRGRRRRILSWLAVTLAIIVAWEGLKWLAGDPWRIEAAPAGIPIRYEHVPPFQLRIASDLSLPHLWEIASAFVEPAQRNGPPLGAILVSQALFTFREALVGFTAGAVLGLLLGVAFVHSKVAERAFVPYVVASQTVPILAISPIIVVATQAGWLSVAIISMYLTFFPMTIGELRGLRAADGRAFELFRSYAASRWSVLWRLRLPASIPFLFSSLRVAAAASVIGAIIGELPSGIPDGLGAALLNYNQYYTSGPDRLWATIVVCSLVGMTFVGLVRLAEWLLTRGRYRPAAVGR